MPISNPMPTSNLKYENCDPMPISNPMPTSNLKYDDYDFMPTKTSNQKTFQVYTMYKHIDKKVRPVPAQFPEDCQIRRTIPEDLLLTLKPLPFNPSEFEPTTKITLEQMKILNVNAKGFLSLEEEKLLKHIMIINEETIAFEDAE